jgi:hypothetical protein
MYDVDVAKIKRFLPAGPVASGEPNSFGGIRERPLLQFFSESASSPKYGSYTSNLHTVAVADIRLKRSEGN